MREYPGGRAWLVRWRAAAGAVIAVLIGGVLTAGCAASAGGRSASPGSPGGSSRSTGDDTVQPQLPTVVANPSRASVLRTAEGMRGLGYQLARVSAQPGKNVVLSPMSVAYALAMLRAGAAGPTAAEIDRVAQFPADVAAVMNQLTRQIVTAGPVPTASTPAGTKDPGQPVAPVAPVVRIANRLYVQDGLPIGAAFTRTLTEQFGASPRSVDFTSPATNKAINDWVRTVTAGRITKLFDSLDPSTQLVLANAIYLKASWQEPFMKGSTQPGAFTLAGGNTARVPMMQRAGVMRYGAGAGWQAVELPYSGGDLAMQVIVPTGSTGAGSTGTGSGAGSTGAVNPVGLLAPTTLAAVRASLKQAVVDVSMPRWDFDTGFDLTKVLPDIGLTHALEPGAFPGISPELSISQAVHRATITVDESGTEAAAVTGVAMQASAIGAPQHTVRADRPFAFVIVHRSTGVPLFVGTVNNPSA